MVHRGHQSQAIVREEFKYGQFIINEGDEGEAFYIIESGEVNIYKKNPAKPEDGHGPGNTVGKNA